MPKSQNMYLGVSISKSSKWQSYARQKLDRRSRSWRGHRRGLRRTINHSLAMDTLLTPGEAICCPQEHPVGLLQLAVDGQEAHRK